MTDPLDHCAINLHLRGPDGELWVFTEHPRAAVTRTSDDMTLGGTTLERRGGELIVRFDERTRPFFQRMPRRIAGEIRLTATAPLFDHPVTLDAAGRHTWWPIAPLARAEVRLDRPALAFSGPAYHDANAGAEGLEDGFARWTWSRTTTADRTAVLYDTQDRDGRCHQQGFLFTPDGQSAPYAASQAITLPRAPWGIDRATRAEPGATARVRETLIAAPFYARSIIETTLAGHPAIGVHEALDCDRFAAPWVRFLLPWRIRHEAR